jgi:hypothetical protein
LPHQVLVSAVRSYPLASLPRLHVVSKRYDVLPRFTVFLMNVPVRLADENKIEVSVWPYLNVTRSSGAVGPDYLMLGNWSDAKSLLEGATSHMVTLEKEFYFGDHSVDVDVRVVMRTLHHPVGSMLNSFPRSECSLRQYCAETTIYATKNIDWFELRIWRNEDLQLARAAVLVNMIEKSLNAALSGKSRLPTEILTYPGFSGSQFRHFMNNIGFNDDIRYLELGVFWGSTLVSTVYGNKVSAVAIDNWADEFLESNASVYEKMQIALEKFKGNSAVKVIRDDVWEVSRDPKQILDGFRGQRANVYFYDAAHDELDHFMALVNYIDLVDDEFVYIVDDWNELFVRDGTQAALKSLALTTLFQAEVLTTSIGNYDRASARIGAWHNGVAVFVLSKPIENSALNGGRILEP